MKTIIPASKNTPETGCPSRRFRIPRRYVGLLAAGAIAVCVLPVTAAILPARGDPQDNSPENVSGRAPSVLQDDPGDMYLDIPVQDPGGSDEVLPDGALSDGALSDGAPADILIEPSGQLVYQGIPEADPETSPAGDAVQDGHDDVDTAAVSVSQNAPDDPAGQPQASEMEELQAELDKARRELEQERKARQEAERAAQAVPAQSEANPADVTEQPAPADPAETDPPSWLLEQGQAAVSQDADQPPEWLVTPLDKAMWRNPYDNGPLGQKSFAQIPCPLENADTRMYVNFDAPLALLTQGDLLYFVRNGVMGCDASWATIVGSDGKGIQFMGCGIDTALYGYLDEYGQVTEVLYFLNLTEYGYVSAGV